jgi:hypothetical protein
MQNMKITSYTFLLMVFVLLANNSYSWDEVTHAYMTNYIPDLVEDGKLKRLLNENKSEFVYGSWYTDSYQYKGPEIKDFNPHNLEVHDAAFISYLQSEEIRKQSNYEQLVALYLGSLAHRAEDMWYDNNLHPYQKTKADKFKGDSRHGAFIAKQYGYINIDVPPYLPIEDLFKLYSQSYVLTGEAARYEYFENAINEWAVNQYKQLTALKLLNFVAGNQLYNVSPWTAANLYEAPGGIRNSAEVAAKFIEMAWNRLNNRIVPLVFHAQYMWPIETITFFASSSLAAKSLNQYDSFVLTENGDTIRGAFESRKEDHLVKRFKPDLPFNEGQNYMFVFKPDTSNTAPQIDGTLTYEFTAIYDHDMHNRLASKMPWHKTMGLSLFVFIPLFGLSLLFFGLTGVISLIGKESKGAISLMWMMLNYLLSLASVSAMLLALYLLFTKAWAFVAAVI